ncbi:MAG TPA: trehalose-6-phosphate synthase [Acidimicrobiales bacterium]|nr:trehalose-6-phosphate synthase [Acidimicrobiales bacterium]
MAELVVVSNRGPLSFRFDDEGRPEPTGTGGGLAGTLRPLLTGTDTTWVAASMNEADRVAFAEGLMVEDGLRTVIVSPDAEAYRMAYDVVSNSTLWFCHHHLFDLPRRPRFDRRWYEAWDAYRAVNEQFAGAVAEEAEPGSVVLVQDYHLSLTGRLLADRRPDLRTVFFMHTPFGDPNALRALPSSPAGELLSGLAGFGACGFHTARWEAAFRACFADRELATYAGTGRAPSSFHAPLGPDPAAIEAEAASPAAAAARAELDERFEGRKLIVRVDRVELSKNLLRGLWAYEELLETKPRWRERVVHLVLAYPSREGLADYLAYRSEVEHTVARINEVFGTASWDPIVLDVADDRDRSVAALSRYDVLLVNPIRDGLNLVAKEGPLVNDRGGVVVISREAGAWEELYPAAVGVNPFDVTGQAAALDLALEMDEGERFRRAARLDEIVRARTAADWLEDQLAAAGARAPAAP